MQRHLPYLLACALSLAAACVQAGVGLAQVPGTAGDAPVTVFYPTAAADRPEALGPFTLPVAREATPQRGNGRLVVVSHGSGGAPWVHADLARRLVDAGFVVAFPEHLRDNHRDAGDAGPESWKRRPAEASRAIDAVARDARFAPLLALDRVGLYGMSAGGHTALVHAGATWSPANFLRHCEAHIADDFHTCVGLFAQQRGNLLDGLKRTVALGVLRHRFDDEAVQAHHDPRIAAIVAGVPASAHLDAASIARPRVPLALVTSGRDLWLVPRFHSDRMLAACLPRCEHLAHLPTAGHGALLAPPPPAERLGETAALLLLDPPGFDRSVLPAVDDSIVRFLRRHVAGE